MHVDAKSPKLIPVLDRRRPCGIRDGCVIMSQYYFMGRCPAYHYLLSCLNHNISAVTRKIGQILKMRWQSLSGAVLAVGALAATPVIDDANLETRADEPCAQVSSLVIPMRAANPRGRFRLIRQWTFANLMLLSNPSNSR